MANLLQQVQDGRAKNAELQVDNDEKTCHNIFGKHSVSSGTFHILKTVRPVELRTETAYQRQLGVVRVPKSSSTPSVSLPESTGNRGTYYIHAKNNEIESGVVDGVMETWHIVQHSEHKMLEEASALQGQAQAAVLKTLNDRCDQDGGDCFLPEAKSIKTLTADLEQNTERKARIDASKAARIVRRQPGAMVNFGEDQEEAGECGDIDGDDPIDRPAGYVSDGRDDVEDDHATPVKTKSERNLAASPTDLASGSVLEYDGGRRGG